MGQRFLEQQAIEAHIAQLELELVELKRKRNTLSPISQLPPELLCRILSLNIVTFTNDDFESPPANPSPSALKFSHVSHFWRAIVRNTPLMWSYIRVGKNTKPELLSFVWKKAESSPVDMNVDSSEGDSRSLGTPVAMDAIVNTIRQHPAKLRSLRLRLDFDPIRHVFEGFKGTFELLQNLLVSDPTKDWGDPQSSDIGDYLVCRAPKLRRFWATGYTLSLACPLLSSSSLKNLRVFQNGGSTEHLFALLCRTDQKLSSIEVGLDSPPSVEIASQQLEIVLDDFHVQASDWRTLVNILLRVRLSSRGTSFSCGTIPDENLPELFSAIAHAHGSLISPGEVRIRTNSVVTYWQDPITHPLVNGTRRLAPAAAHDELCYPDTYLETKGKVPFDSPEYYQTGWSFSDLRVLTLAAEVPHGLWDVLAYSTPLEVLRCGPGIDCYDVFESLRSSRPLPEKGPPFRFLQAFVTTFGVPFNYDARRRRKRAGFNPVERKGYHLDLADILMERRRAFESASEPWQPLALLDFRKFRESDLKKEDLKTLLTVAKEVVWEERGWWVEGLDYERQATGAHMDLQVEVPCPIALSNPSSV